MGINWGFKKGVFNCGHKVQLQGHSLEDNLREFSHGFVKSGVRPLNGRLKSWEWGLR